METSKAPAPWVPVEPPKDLLDSLMILRGIDEKEANKTIRQIQKLEKEQYFKFLTEENEQRNRF